MRDVNPHRREPNFDVRDKVRLNARKIPIDRPESLKNVHPVSYTKLLRKDPCNPVPGQEIKNP